MKKICFTCKVEKDLEDFLSHKGHKDGKRSECKVCTSERGKKRYLEKLKPNPEFREWNRKRNIEWYYKNREASSAKNKLNEKKKRLQVLEHYGHFCACCGETQYEFLSIDHIDGGGRQHRKEVGSRIATWIIKNDFPKNFRILCHNCNQSHGYHGYCPHQTKKT